MQRGRQIADQRISQPQSRKLRRNCSQDSVATAIAAIPRHVCMTEGVSETSEQSVAHSPLYIVIAFPEPGYIDSED